jgi:multiple sugar transport system permease protein
MSEADTKLPAVHRRTGQPPPRRAPQSGFGRGPVGFLLSFKLWALAPLVVFFVLFAVYPLIELVRMALSTVNLQNGLFTWHFSGTANLRKAFHDSTFATAVTNSVVFAVATTILTVVIGTALAVLVSRARLLRGIARNIFLWPAVIAPVAVSVLWLLVYDSQLGLLNKILADVGLPGQGWLGRGHSALAAVIVVDVWHWTPIVFVFVSAALASIDEEILDAARVDGAGGWQVLRHVTLPLLMPTIAVVTGIRIIMASKVFDEMYLLTHGGPGTSTTVVSIYVRNVFFDRVDLGYGAALGLIIVIAIVLVFLFAVLLRSLTRRSR